MNKLGIESIIMYKDYLKFENDNYVVIFSTAEDNKSFNRHTEEGVNTLNKLKDEFNVKEVVYLRQVHSDKILQIKEDNIKDIIEEEGDALIGNINNIAFGVFTADCVPVLLIDEVKKVGAVIHSGWKGTYYSITKKTIEELIKKYGSDIKDIKAFIGPHIRQCCYEVSEELKERFINKKQIEEELLFHGRNLSMEECILKDLRDNGIIEERINSINLCTHCSKDIKLHSYRKSNGDYGRLFSFIIFK